MKRTDLLATIQRAAPALLSGDSTVPVLGYFCFDGRRVTAYDSAVAIQAQCDLPLTGAVSGALLLSILKASSAKEVVPEISDTEVNFKLGRANLRLAVKPPEEFLFRRPSVKGVHLPLSPKLVKAIELASRCGSDESSGLQSAMQGITIAFNGPRANIYATDATLLLHAAVKIAAETLDGKAFILSRRFYQLLLKGDYKELIFTKDQDVVAVGDGIELFGRVIEGADPAKYSQTLKGAYPDKTTLVEMPKGLLAAVQRTNLVNKDRIELTYAKGKLKMYTRGICGDIKDSVAVDFGAEPIAVATCSDIMLKFLDLTERVRLTDRCFALAGAGWRAMVAVTGIEE
jgi:hypothetical protein